MANAIKAARKAIEARFIAEFTDLKVFTDNKKEFPDDTGLGWVRLSVQHTGRIQKTLGQEGGRRFRSSGSVFIQLFTPIGKGMTEPDGPDDLTSKAAEVFDAVNVLIYPTPIYYGRILAADASDLAAAEVFAATIGVNTLDMADATDDITIGPSVAGDFFLILVPAAHDLITLVNQGTQADARSTYSRSENVRSDLGTPTEKYDAYIHRPLNAGVTIRYRLTLDPPPVAAREPSTVYFEAATTRESGLEGKWFTVLVEAPFEYDEIR